MLFVAFLFVFATLSPLWTNAACGAMLGVALSFALDENGVLRRRKM